MHISGFRVTCIPVWFSLISLQETEVFKFNENYFTRFIKNLKRVKRRGPWRSGVDHNVWAGKTVFPAVLPASLIPNSDAINYHGNVDLCETPEGSVSGRIMPESEPEPESQDPDRPQLPFVFGRGKYQYSLNHNCSCGWPLKNFNCLVGDGLGWVCVLM